MLNLKLIIFLVVTTLLSALIATNYYLYNDNKSLQSSVDALQRDIKLYEDVVEKKKQEKEVIDSTLETVLEEYETVKSSFKDIEDDFNKRKCRPGKSDNAHTTGLDNGDVANDLSFVSGLLHKASCNANNNCDKPSESSSKPL